MSDILGHLNQNPDKFINGKGKHSHVYKLQYIFSLSLFYLFFYLFSNCVRKKLYNLNLLIMIPVFLLASSLSLNSEMWQHCKTI